MLSLVLRVFPFIPIFIRFCTVHNSLCELTQNSAEYLACLHIQTHNFLSSVFLLDRSFYTALLALRITTVGIQGQLLYTLNAENMKEFESHTSFKEGDSDRRVVELQGLRRACFKHINQNISYNILKTIKYILQCLLPSNEDPRLF